MTSQEKFPHRHNSNGTHDSICRVCLATVATSFRETDLAGFELRHLCDPVRVYRISQGWVTNPAISSYPQMWSEGNTRKPLTHLV